MQQGLGIQIIMRRLAIVAVCAGVSVGLSAARAAAQQEEELLLETPKTNVAPRPPPAQHAAPGRVHQAAAGKAALSRKASKAMASAHRRAPPNMMVTKARPLPVVSNPAPSFYVGVHFGGGWSHAIPPIDAKSVNGGGVIGGGQIGVNYQVEKLVFGIEADISASDVSGNVSGDLGGVAVNGSLRNDWFATLAGRFGFATNAMLLYAKAGGAWTRYKWDFAAPAGGTASASENRAGWMVGVGVEHALTGAVSARIEYNYMNFGHRTETLSTTGGLVALPTQVRLDAHVVKLGFNHRFAF
jgi:outer membrane immunogenic protein